MKQNFISLLLFCCCLVFVTGCNRLDEAGRKNISGTVTLEGANLEGAIIQFSPLETQAPEGAGVIGGSRMLDSEGKYQLLKDMGLYAGTYKVRISLIHVFDKTTGKQLIGDELAPYKENPGNYKVVYVVPEKYNTKSELVVTVGEEKNQTHNFELTK